MGMARPGLRLIFRVPGWRIVALAHQSRNAVDGGMPLSFGGVPSVAQCGFHCGRCGGNIGDKVKV